MSADGSFKMDNVPQEMRKVLEEIARQKAISGEATPRSSANGGGTGHILTAEPLKVPCSY